MDAELHKKLPDVEVKLVPGEKGIFDVFADDRLVFSKHREKRFPTHEEILEALQSR